jgi:hypothetical protein
MNLEGKTFNHTENSISSKGGSTGAGGQGPLLAWPPLACIVRLGVQGVGPRGWQEELQE